MVDRVVMLVHPVVESVGMVWEGMVWSANVVKDCVVVGFAKQVVWGDQQQQQQQ